MTTVTGLTAARMLQIEAASVVDGDVIGGNLILTKHDGTTINAGPVTGPQGPAGPVGQDLSVLSAIPVLDVGLANQIRAGRQLTLQDFTNLGLNPPLGLWNLSDLTDASGNARALSNKGAIPFAPGINGVANTSAQFSGNAAQALYISDVGAADPFRIKTGTLGAWFRTAKRGVNQQLISKWSATAGQSGPFLLYVGGGSNSIAMCISTTGSDAPVANGISDVADDRWHFAVGTFDGTYLRSYVDGVLEATASINGATFPGNGPFNIGGLYGDGATAAQQTFYGRIDEAFVTADILSDDQIRNLYCAKIAHALPTTPTRVSLNVRRRKKGAALVAADFPTQPLRLHNFSAGSLGDEGSNAVALTMGGTAPPVAGADGTSNNAFGFNTSQALYSTDAGLPGVLTSRSYGCWFKTLSTPAAGMVIMGWGLLSTSSRAGILDSNGNVFCASGNDVMNGGKFGADGQWHFLVVTEDNAPVDGIKRKLYLDGRLIANSTVLNSLTLNGANAFRIGAAVDGTAAFNGQIDGVFICGYVLTAEQIATLYAKGSQALAISPKNSGDHIEAIRANDLLATFDTLESQYQIDLAVA